MSEEPWTILKFLHWTTYYFKEKGVTEPRASAEVLLTHVLCRDRLFLYLNFERPLEPIELSAFRECIKRRVAGEPNQYITGTQEFWSLPLHVTPDVLIPRPETETLVEAVLDFLESTNAQAYVMDLGTGSGAIAVALATELPKARIVATDISPDALRLASENALRHGVRKRISFVCADMFGGLSKEREKFTVVVTNPPYVSQVEFAKLPREIRDYEPSHALNGGPDGLTVISRILKDAPLFLRLPGCLILEIGAGQAAQVSELVTQTHGYGQHRFLKDYNGIDRVLVAERG